MALPRPLIASVVHPVQVLEKVRINASHNQFIGGRRGACKGEV